MTINNISFVDKYANVRNAHKVCQSLSDFMMTDKMQKRMDKVPSTDVVYLNLPEVEKDGDVFVATNPGLIYCKDYSQSPSSKKEFFEYEVDVQKGLDKKAVKKWFDAALKQTTSKKPN